MSEFPIYRDGQPFTIVEVHEGDLLGSVTLRGEAGEVIVPAAEVYRALYAIRLTYPGGHSFVLTGSHGQPLAWPWVDAVEYVERVSALPINKGLTFTVETARV